MAIIQEYRVGNFAKDEKSGVILKVVGTTEKGASFYVMDRDKYPLKDGWSARHLPLTMEVFRKAGFTYDNWHWTIGKNPLTRNHLLDITWIDGDEFSFFRNGHHKIKYVHQLQNLYFLLSGKELNLNL